MQLEPSPGKAGPLRNRLQAAACMLLAAGAPGVAHAESDAGWQLDGSALFYGEQGRARVVEPVARITRYFQNGQSLSAQIGVDAITGASPTGAVPSGRVQTTTTPSGNIKTIPAGQVPRNPFQDHRGSLDLEWLKPMGLCLMSTGGHFSREKDYQSLGASGKLSFEVMDRLTTISVGGGFDSDRITPTSGGSGERGEGDDEGEDHEGGDDDRGLARGTSLQDPGPFGEPSDGGVPLLVGSRSKHVANGVFGLSRILTRRWMVAVDASHTAERGYLTEPYKVVSLLDGANGLAVGVVPESRPSSRDRTSILTSTVYHFTDDVLYLSHRYYWDDWGIRSNTVDVKYRRELPRETYVQPHVRLYEQSASNFFRTGLLQGTAAPQFVSSDVRLGPLRTMTLGATYGYHPTSIPGEVSVRAEYMRQWTDRSVRSGAGARGPFDAFPPLNIGSVMIAYTTRF